MAQMGMYSLGLTHIFESVADCVIIDNICMNRAISPRRADLIMTCVKNDCVVMRPEGSSTILSASIVPNCSATCLLSETFEKELNMSFKEGGSASLYVID